MSSFLALPRSLPAAFLTLFLTCGAAFGQTTLLSPNSLSALHLVGGGLASGSIQTVTDGPTDPVSGTVYTQAWDVNVTSTSTPPVPYNVKLYATNAVAVAKGEALVATFFYRRVDDTPDEANVNAYFESQASPITKAVSLSLRGRKTWRRASIPFICDKDYAVGGAQFDFQLSWQIQHIQVAGFTLVTYGQKSVFASGSIDATPSFSFSGGTWATDTSVAVTGQPFFTAASKLQMTVWPPHWDSVQLTAQVPLSGGAVNTIHSGDTLVALFWMCGTSPDTVNLAIGGPEAVGASGTLSLDQGNLMVDSTWKQHYVAFTAKENYAAGALHFYFRCGMKPQTVQFAGLQLIDLGSAVAAATLTGTQYDYPGRAIDASWRTAANTRIAQNREGTLTVNVTGASNQALSGVAVSAAMTKHLFGFGAEVSGQRVANGTGADSDRYRAETASLFNKAVLGNELKWLKWIESGDPAVAVSAMAWLRQKGIFDLRGHNLIWPSWTFSPSALSGMTTTQLQQAILDHFADEPAAPGVRQLIGDWDVVNESHKQRDILDKLEGMPAGQHGTANDDASWIASWLAAASAADPYPYLFLNDYGTEDNPNQLDLSTQNYQLQLIANLQNAGAPIDGFGFQSHMNLSFT
ncbi:MAG TPA: endo-1,4-beta-xylanase, partial [Candidatus Methylacidiphilales bacterium]